MKILIIGNSGSGKTTLAKKLSAELEIDYFEMDDIFWDRSSYNVKNSPEEIERQVRCILEKPSWIVEGVFGNIAEKFIDEVDRVLWLDKPWEECFSNLEKREPDYSKFPTEKEAQKSFAELKG